MTFQTSITIGDHDVTIDAEYRHTPDEPETDTAGSVEITAARDHDTGKLLNLTDAQYEEIEARIWRKIKRAQREPAEFCP